MVTIFQFCIGAVLVYIHYKLLRCVASCCAGKPEIKESAEFFRIPMSKALQDGLLRLKRITKTRSTTSKISIPVTRGGETVGKVSAFYTQPQRASKFSEFGVVVTHPWSILGGDMYNNIPKELCSMLAKTGMFTVRFNFRGGGISRGYNEIDDVISVVEYLCKTDGQHVPRPKKIILIGHSYGAMIASAAAGLHPSIVGFVALSPPLPMYWALSLFNGAALREDSRIPKPKLLICGSKDQFCSEKAFLNDYISQESPKRGYYIDGLDHFWRRQEAGAFDMIMTWVNHILLAKFINGHYVTPRLNGACPFDLPK